jgi:hypothetical protein
MNRRRKKKLFKISGEETEEAFLPHHLEEGKIVTGKAKE